MGIKLLNTFLKSNRCNGICEKHLSEFYGKKICIDVSIYMYRYKSEEQLIEKIYLLCVLLKYYNIKGMFVFDENHQKKKMKPYWNVNELNKMRKIKYNFWKKK